MPQIGLGLWQVSDDETVNVVNEAVRLGYRSIDSAQIYQNEAGLGKAIATCGVSRKELFITTKIWNTEQGFDSAKRSFDVSLRKLATPYVDLLLVHWPAPRQNRYVDTWKTLIDLRNDGVVRSIGVSNFTVTNLQRIIDETGVVPAVNQIELHPYFQQHELVEFHNKYDIQTECWSPLGQGKVITDPVIGEIAKKHQRTPAQIILRWHLEKKFIAIPKSVKLSRIAENISIFDFALDAEDQFQLARLDSKDGRVGPDPDTANF